MRRRYGSGDLEVVKSEVEAIKNDLEKIKSALFYGNGDSVIQEIAVIKEKVLNIDQKINDLKSLNFKIIIALIGVVLNFVFIIASKFF